MSDTQTAAKPVGEQRRRTLPDEAAEEAALAAAWVQSAAARTEARMAELGGTHAVGGMERLIRSRQVAYDRLPMLDLAFDRMARTMSTSLRQLTNENVEIALEAIKSVRIGEHLEATVLPSIFAVVKAEEWDNHALLIVDSAMICTMVDLLLGGRRASGPARIEGRAFTRIERTLAERLVRLVVDGLSASFEPLCAVTFRVERMEAHPRFASIVRHANAAIVARLRVGMDDRGGMIEVILPHGTLEPVRELLVQEFMGERSGQDSIWEAHLAEELRHTEVELSAVLDEQVMRLSDVMSLQTGSRILLNVGRGASVQIRCGGVPLFEARVGRRKNRVAVCIERETVWTGHDVG